MAVTNILINPYGKPTVYRENEEVSMRIYGGILHDQIIIMDAHFQFRNTNQADYYLNCLSEIWSGSYSVNGQSTRVVLNTHLTPSENGKYIIVEYFADRKDKDNCCCWSVFTGTTEMSIVKLFKYDPSGKERQELNIIFAHEFGHCLGIRDHYLDPGGDFPSIMNRISFGVTDYDIAMALLAFQTGNRQRWGE